MPSKDTFLLLRARALMEPGLKTEGDSGCHPTCPRLSHKPPPKLGFHVSLALAFSTPYFNGMLHSVRPRRKLLIMELGNVRKESYLPKAVLNQCCLNIY